MPPLTASEQSGSPLLQHFVCTLAKRWRLSIRDWRTLLFEFVFPILLCSLVIVLIRVNSPVDMPVQLYDETMYSDEYPLRFPITADPNVNASLVPSLVENINKNAHVKATQEYVNTPSDLDQQVLFPIKSGKLKGGTFLKLNQLGIINSTTLVNTRSGGGAFVLTTLLAQAMISEKTGRPLTIKMTNHPLPLTEIQRTTSRDISGYIGAVGFGFALSFKFAAVICQVVKERE